MMRIEQLSGDKRATFWISFLAVALGVVAVYYPSLFHAPRADQIGYLADMAHKRGWWAYTLGSYDLNRVRIFCPGDEFLFRPLFYFILGNEAYFFGYNFVFWQGLGIVVHLAVVYALFKVLFLIRPGLGAVLGTAYFALMMMNVEMVTWHHITPYMIFVVLVLIALYHACQIVLFERVETRRFVTIAVALFLAAFIYETGILFAVFFGAVLWKPATRLNRQWIFAIFSIPLVYAALSVGHLALTHPLMAPEQPGEPDGNLLLRLFSPFLATAWWIYSGLLPTQNAVSLTDRTIVNLAQTKLFKPFDWEVMQTWIVAGLIGTLALLAVRSQPKKKPSARLAILLVSMIGAYVMVIAGGRFAARGINWTLYSNLNYLYIFWVLLIVLLFLLAPDPFWNCPALKGAAVALMGLLIVHNAILTLTANYGRAMYSEPRLALIETVETIIGAKGREPGFSLHVDDDYPGNGLVEVISVRGTWKPVRSTLIEMLYPRYARRSNARYNLQGPVKR